MQCNDIQCIITSPPGLLINSGVFFKFKCLPYDTAGLVPCSLTWFKADFPHWDCFLTVSRNREVVTHLLMTHEHLLYCYMKRCCVDQCFSTFFEPQ